MTDIKFLNMLENSLKVSALPFSNENFFKLFSMYKKAVKTALSERKEYVDNLDELFEVAEHDEEINIYDFEFKRKKRETNNKFPTLSASEIYRYKDLYDMYPQTEVPAYIIERLFNTYKYYCDLYLRYKKLNSKILAELQKNEVKE